MNKKYSEIDFEREMDIYINKFLKQTIKSCIQIKKQVYPKVILKESFIIDISRKAINYYITKTTALNISIFDKNNMNMVEEVVSAIIERHIFYILNASEKERIGLQTSEKYKKKIIEETVNDFIFNKHLGIVSYNLNVAFYPPVSKLILLNNLLFNLFSLTKQIEIKNDKFVAINNVMNRIMEQIKSCCVLLDKYLIADAIAIWRSLYESELTLIVLTYWDETISKEYLEFVDYQYLKRDINITQKNKEDLKQALENKAQQRGFKKASNNFINYGWLMQTQEFYDKKCKLNLKDGLATIAEEHIKYSSYQLASNISHSPFFSKGLDSFSMFTYIVEMIYFSFGTIIEAIYYYLDECKITVNENLKKDIENNLKELFNMIEIMLKNLNIDKKE